MIDSRLEPFSSDEETGKSRIEDDHNVKLFHAKFKKVTEINNILMQRFNNNQVFPICANRLISYRFVQSLCYRSFEGIIHDGTFTQFLQFCEYNSFIPDKWEEVISDESVKTEFANLVNIFSACKGGYEKQMTDIMHSLLNKIASVPNTWVSSIERDKLVIASGIASVAQSQVTSHVKRFSVDHTPGICSLPSLLLSKSQKSEATVAVTVEWYPWVQQKGERRFPGKTTKWFKRGSSFAKVLTDMIGSGAKVALYFCNGQFKLFWRSISENNQYVMKTFPSGTTCGTVDDSFLYILYCLLRMSSVQLPYSLSKIPIKTHTLDAWANHDNYQISNVSSVMFTTRLNKSLLLSRIVPDSKTRSKLLTYCFSIDDSCNCGLVHEWDARSGSVEDELN